MMQGTRLSVWLVFAFMEPSAACLTLPFLSTSYISSALPWSAVMIAAPCSLSTTLRMRARQRSSASIEHWVAGKLPVWPTMSPFGKLTRRQRYLPLSRHSISLSVISAHFIHGRCSKGTTSEGISM